MTAADTTVEPALRPIIVLIPSPIKSRKKSFISDYNAIHITHIDMIIINSMTFTRKIFVKENHVQVGEAVHGIQKEY